LLRDYDYKRYQKKHHQNPTRKQVGHCELRNTCPKFPNFPGKEEKNMCLLCWSFGSSRQNALACGMMSESSQSTRSLVNLLCIARVAASVADMSGTFASCIWPVRTRTKMSKSSRQPDSRLIHNKPRGNRTREGECPSLGAVEMARFNTVVWQLHRQSTTRIRDFRGSSQKKKNGN
jgi:hypothetical protein